MTLHVLLSNDDGVHAPGLSSLRERIKRDHRVSVIAPLEERSTTGHSLSLDKPLRLEAFGDGVYGCSGFPGDCILMGLGHVLKGDRPNLVISGINRGANLGQDLYYSGTVAAAREAAFHNVPSIAVSLVFKNFTDPNPSYDTAAEVISWLVGHGIEKFIPPLTLLNVNVPNIALGDLKGIRFTGIGFRKYSEEVQARTDSRGRAYFWIAGHYEGFNSDETSDCDAVEKGFVSVTPHVLVGATQPNWDSLKHLLDKINVQRFS